MQVSRTSGVSGAVPAEAESSCLYRREYVHPVLKHFAGQKVSDHTAAEGDGQISEHGKILLHGNACGLTAAQAVRLARTFGF